MSLRTFIFVHHFAGQENPLSKALVKEAKSRRVRLRVISVEKASGSGDLLQDKPYKDHLTWAQRGRIDGYHAGFPCSTFSRLRHCREPVLPPPVRTKAEPYGMKVNTRAQQEECDRGTVMASRSITMAKLGANRKRGGRIRAIATLENHPPSSLEDHLSAWELPEMQEFSWTTSSCRQQTSTPASTNPTCQWDTGTSSLNNSRARCWASRSWKAGASVVKALATSRSSAEKDPGPPARTPMSCVTSTRDASSPSSS